MSLQFAKDESVVTVQRRFCTKYQRRAPTDTTIHSWYNKFEATGCLWDAKRTGRPGPSAGSVNRVRETFARSPRKSTSWDLQISQPTVWRILRKRLDVKPYRLQLLRSLSPQGHHFRTQFFVNFQEKLQEDRLSEKVFLRNFLSYCLQSSTKATI